MNRDEIRSTVDAIADGIGRGLSRALHRPRRLRTEEVNATFDNQDRVFLVAVRVRAGDRVGSFPPDTGGGAGFEVAIHAAEVGFAQVHQAFAEIDGRLIKRYGSRETWTSLTEESG